MQANVNSYPQVLEVFRIIINFIWSTLTIQINIGNGYSFTLFHIIVFVFILITLLGVFTLEIPKFKGGWDTYGKFSVKQSNVIKSNKRK